MNVPPLGFTLQDSAQPIPNLNTNLLVGNYAEVRCDFPLLPMDFVNINVISNILGGDHNQSFSIGQASPSLTALIPRERVEANEGNSVRLRVSIRRNGVSTPANDATVTINRRPVVTPTPDTVWDFNDGTLQGWVPQGSYVGLLRVINNEVVVNLPNSVPGASHIITRSVPVIAGRTYNCIFNARTDLPAADGSRVYMTMNGKSIGRAAALLPGFTLLGSGTFIAPITGSVHLGIFNEAVPTGIHQFALDNVSITLMP
ncbi:hypothetical protein AZH11_09095 [Pseudomonas simiae]|nr:hypothetical protein AZH11_09095 [Pseudomonas simiae]